jgi:hypothetical protein
MLFKKSKKTKKSKKQLVAEVRFKLWLLQDSLEYGREHIAEAAKSPTYTKEEVIKAIEQIYTHIISRIEEIEEGFE